ncbi:MAG: hypothetical protein ACRC32_21745 [Chroococcidiopsis sp.]
MLQLTPKFTLNVKVTLEKPIASAKSRSVFLLTTLNDRVILEKSTRETHQMKNLPVLHQKLYKLIIEFDSLVTEDDRLRRSLDGDAIKVYEAIQACLIAIRENEKRQSK